MANDKTTNYLKQLQNEYPTYPSYFASDLLQSRFLQEDDILKLIQENKKVIESLKTDEEKKRDKLFTRLLRDYINNYKSKSRFTKSKRYSLCILCEKLIVVTFMLLVTLVVVSIFKQDSTVKDVVLLATSMITLLGTFCGLIKIVFEYVFPKDDEQYITKIVASVQEYDISNKHENLSYMTFTTNQKKEADENNKTKTD